MEQINDAVVLIDGVDVTAWIIGPVTWEQNPEDPEAKGTCTLKLNNSRDAFMVTPGNVCSGPSVPDAWQPCEQAKYRLYCAKLAQSQKVQTQQGHGMWGYSLAPYQPVLHKFDRLDVYRARGTAPLFSHHIDNYSMVDNLVSGTRVMDVRGCAD